MEKEPKKPEDQIEREKTPIEMFREEIAAIARAELEGTQKTAHFLKEQKEREIDESFSVEELTEEDREIWEDIKNETVTFQKFNIYRDKVKASGSPARKIFAKFAANKATPIII